MNILSLTATVQFYGAKHWRIGKDNAASVIMCSDGGYALAGSTYSFGAG